ncbi:IS630 family transposase [Kovacikia minuta CCNUW1]|uniref:IS630 family transposase n=1 Tax=Kovacikia minuta TaxID=2931930 RepID=UPI001CCDE41E|nr:IS630 family transposase [Kovacikia minuta]UBF23992.1 IS630 family transposase [Kovacikia minuta CCNUW1]
MPAPLRIHLTAEEDRTLTELRLAQNLPQRTRDRAHMLRLNAQGWNVPAIADVFECHPHTVRATLRRWEEKGLGGLWEAPGRGAKPKWHASDLDYLTECLEHEPRTYNSLQLAKKLKQERSVDLSSDRLRRLLKKNYRWKRTRQSHRKKQDPLQKARKQADLETLELAAQAGHIELKYLDEAGFCLWSPVSYSYSRVGVQKRMEQTLKRYGNRISILGLWQPGERFEYALVQGGFKGKSYIKVMDWMADKAAQTLAQTGRITVVVQDNGSLHTSQLVRQQWSRWQEQGLFFFFLPPYCSEMNPIETQWHQLKCHETSSD